MGIETFYEAAPNPANVRFEAVEDLQRFGLEMLSYFEPPPLQEALGNRDVFTVLRQASPIWFAEVVERKEILVAGACNHPNLLVLPFSLELVRLAE